jgi:hypothetical protein
MRNLVIAITLVAAVLLSSSLVIGTGGLTQQSSGPRNQRGSDAEPRITGLYSDATYDSRSGDTVGMQVFIVGDLEKESVRYSALVQFLEGIPRRPSLVEVVVHGSDVNFSVPMGGGAVNKFRGRIRGNVLEGEFSHNNEKVRLQRQTCVPQR